jgi:CubicO group peptidase (beta-lactamase class C family)
MTRIALERMAGRRSGKVAVVMLLGLFVALPLAAQTVPRAKPEEVGLASEGLQRIDAIVQRFMERGEISGAVTLVARNGKIARLKSQGVLDLETKAAMRDDAVFRIASMTKPITATAIMILVEEGRLRLTDPVSKFIPEFKNLNVETQAPEGVAPAAREITIRDILTHTSGVGSKGRDWPPAVKLLESRTAETTLAEFIPRVAALPLNFQPGTEWRYSNFLGFETLGRVVEIVSGQTYDQFLRQRIFEPLGMKDTGFYVQLPQERRPRVPTFYRKGETGLFKSPDTFNPTIARPRYLSGSGGLATTAEDYLRFAQMTLDGGELNGTRIVTRGSIEQMTSNQTADLYTKTKPGYVFGLAVEVLQDPAVGRLASAPGAYGWTGAIGTYYWVDPQRQLIGILMIQTWGTPEVNELRQEFRAAVNQALLN